ncbi:MAG TPA: hypothetical protein VNG51_23420 [Ktedonobacteraceae bacterium]|nr:hypothetical protein [Ktedonobacteraceae bacterium]
MQEQLPTTSAQQTLHHRRTLFQHTPATQNPPRNVNLVHEAEKAAAGFNTRLAVGLTQRVGTMWTAYTFAVLAIIGLFAILGLISPTIALLVAWVSQTFIQLVLLPIIMVGQNVLGRKAELQSEEQYNTTINTYHDIEQIMEHLTAQDTELLKQTHILIHMLKASGTTLDEILAEINTGTLTSNTNGTNMTNNANTTTTSTQPTM